MNETWEIVPYTSASIVWRPRPLLRDFFTWVGDHINNTTIAQTAASPCPIHIHLRTVIWSWRMLSDDWCQLALRQELLSLHFATHLRRLETRDSLRRAKCSREGERRIHKFDNESVSEKLYRNTTPHELTLNMVRWFERRSSAMYDITGLARHFFRII